MLSWFAISALSHPCNSSSTICCSRGPSRTVCSFIPSSPFVRFASPGQVWTMFFLKLIASALPFLRFWPLIKHKSLFHRDLQATPRQTEVSSISPRVPMVGRIIPDGAENPRQNTHKGHYAAWASRAPRMPSPQCTLRREDAGSNEYVRYFRRDLKPVRDVRRSQVNTLDETSRPYTDHGHNLH